MNPPSNLKYTASHEWIRHEDDGSVSIGITDFAQTALGDVVFLELPEIGRKVNAGDACAVIESVKAASDIYAPLTGEITAVNEAAKSTPESINTDAYVIWLFRLKPIDIADLDNLMSAEEYAKTMGN